jgi:phosphate/sulfate permease
MENGKTKMTGKTLLHIIFIRLVFMIIIVVVAGLIAGIVAFIVSNFTDDIDIIVKSCLISIWIAEILVIIFRNRITYYERIKSIDINDMEKLKKEKDKLKKWYILSTVLFSIFFGFILYNIKGRIINSINGTGQDITQETINSPTLYLKITIVLIIIFIVRIILSKKNKNNENIGNKI